MRKIAVYNRKGGVGKTTLTKDLAWEFARLGMRVAVVELDPQCSIAELAGLGFDTPPEQTVARLLLYPDVGMAATDIRGAVHDSPWGPVKVNPAALSLTAAAEQLKTVRVQPDRRLDQGLGLLEQAGEQFDVVLIDCPPAFDMLTVNALITCDVMLVPTKADHLDAAGLAVLDEVEAEVRAGTRTSGSWSS